MPGRSLLYLAPAGTDADPALDDLAGACELELLRAETPAEILTWVNRSYPGIVVVDGGTPREHALDLCRSIKGEPFTAVVPVVLLLEDDDHGAISDALQAGADEVLTHRNSGRERGLRLQMAVRRADRDVSVHPTTRLPGTVQIERDITERLQSGEPFAVCYADLDHFKEFNDRYGYNNGDRVVYITSRILRDVVRAYSPSGFVGHIGGDDFIFNVSLDEMDGCCKEILEVFDTLMPYQYPEDIRERGYYWGKDRRGELYRVPLMSLSIGVVTNRLRSFAHTAEVSRVASEMKTFAKTKPGSVYLVDRRTTPASTRAAD